VHFLDDARLHIGRGALGCPQSVPGGDGVVGQAHFGGARHVREGGVALVARHHERTDAATLDVCGRRAQAIEHHVHIAGDQVLQRRARAAVRNVGDEGLGLLLEQLARQVVRSAGTGRAVVELARVFAHLLQHALEITRHPPGIDHHHLRHVGHQQQRHEVLLDVVVEPGVHRRRNGMVHAPMNRL